MTYCFLIVNPVEDDRPDHTGNMPLEKDSVMTTGNIKPMFAAGSFDCEPGPARIGQDRKLYMLHDENRDDRVIYKTLV